jgi:hypothetical protein
MQGERKPYDEKLAKWSEPKEFQVQAWLEDSGYTVTHNNFSSGGKKGVDLYCKRPEEEFYVEVERGEFTGKRFQGNRLAFPTLHVLERRNRYSKFTVCLTLNEAGTVGIVSFKYSWRNERLVNIPNRLKRRGEKAFDVPVEECLYVDLTTPLSHTLAVLNAERVRRVVEGGYSHAMKTATLGPYEEPHGMTHSEWRRRHEEIDREYKKLIGTRCPDPHINPETWIKDGTDGRGFFRMICPECRRFMGYKPVYRRA